MNSVSTPWWRRLLARASGFPESPETTINNGTTVAIPLRGDSPIDYQRSGTNVRKLGFEKHPVVNACIRAIADIVMAVPFEAYRLETDGEVYVIPTAEPQRLLESPSPGMSAARLRHITAAHYLMYGNAFWHLDRRRPNARPTGIHLIHPEDVMTVYADEQGTPVKYTWRNTMGHMYTSPAEDIVHFRDIPSGKTSVFGFPRAAAALNDIVGDNEASQYVRQVVTNDGTPTLAMLVDENTTQEEARVAEARWHERMVNRGQRGRVAFVGGVKDIKVIGFNLSDLEFPDLRRVAREDICAAFGVDPRMVGVASASSDGGLSGVQYREARVRLIQHTVEPMLEVISSELNLWYTPEWGDWWVRFSPKRLASLVEDDVATSTRILAEVRDNVRTIQEAREAVGLPTEMDPLHTLVVAGTTQLMPVALAVLSEDTLLGATPTDGTAPTMETEDAGGEEDAASQTPKMSTAEMEAEDQAVLNEEEDTSAVSRNLPSRLVRSGVLLSPEQRTAVWRDFDQRATKDEATYRRQALLLFSEERDAVNKIFESAAKAADSGRATPKAKTNPLSKDDPYLAEALRRARAGYEPGGAFHQRWADRYQRLIGETYSVAASKMAAEIGVNFSLENPRVQKAIQDRATRLADLVGKTTSREVTQAVSAGRKAGMGIREIAKLIDKAVYTNMGTQRATMIARTETVGALNEGEYSTAAQSGVMATKEWLSQGDDRVREDHALVDGARIPMEDVFPIGVRYPGDQEGEADQVINCRCTLLYYDT